MGGGGWGAGPAGSEISQTKVNTVLSHLYVESEKKKKKLTERGIRFVVTTKDPRWPKNPEKAASGGIRLPDFKLCHKVTVSKLWYWHKARHVDQWHKTDSEIIYNKGAKNIQWKMDSCLSKWVGKTGQPQANE